MSSRSVWPWLVLLAGCRSVPEVEFAAEPVETTVPPTPAAMTTTAMTTTAMTTTATTASNTIDDRSVSCVLRVSVRAGEPERFEATGATHREACAKAWRAASDARPSAVVQKIDDVPAYDLVRALKAGAWKAPEGADGSTTCEVVMDRRGGIIEGVGTSSTSKADAEKVAEQDLCRQLGPKCKTDDLGSRSTIISTTRISGATTYRYAIRYWGRVQETQTRSATSRRSWPHACREAMGTWRGEGAVTIVTIDGIPLKALRGVRISPFSPGP